MKKNGLLLKNLFILFLVGVVFSLLYFFIFPDFKFFDLKNFLPNIFRIRKITENEAPSFSSPFASLGVDESGSSKSLDVRGRVLEIDPGEFIKVDDEVSGRVKTLDIAYINSIYYKFSTVGSTFPQRQVADFSDIVEGDFVYFHKGTETLYILKEDFVE